MEDDVTDAAQRVPGKIARVVTDAILGAHPVMARLNEEERQAATARFLDGLEEHTAKLVNPVLKSVTDVTTIPPELRPLLEELGAPSEQFTGIISQFFIFGVMFNVAGAMLAPFVQEIQNDVWSAHPDRPVPPADLATMTVRGLDWSTTAITEVIGDNVTEAAKSGFDAQHFQALVDATGMAPNLQLLFEMVRRGVIDEGTLNAGGETLVSGIQRSDIQDDWIPNVAKLRYVPPSPTDLVAAAVRHQTDELPAGVDLSYWETLAESLGLEPPNWINGNPNWFNMLYNSYGRPLGPQEMARLANRGQLPWSGLGSTVLSFEQGIAESDIKDKWEAAAVLLAQYWPAVGETGSLLKEGGLTEAQAQAYWVAEGVPGELLAALEYVNTIQQVTQDRALAKGDILMLLQEQAITDAEAETMLAQIGYSGDNATFLIAMAHFRYELEALRTSIRSVSTLYTSGAITAAQAKEGFAGLGMPTSQIDSLVATLMNQRAVHVVLPSAAQIATALFYNIISQAQAMQFLEAQGYSAFNAWLVLSVRVHAPLPNPPGNFVPPSPPPPGIVNTGGAGPTGAGSIAQGIPTANVVALADVATFTDQLTPTTYNENPVTYVVVTSSPLISVSPSGAIKVNGTPPVGAIYIAGTMSDGLGDTGTWSYTLTFN